jgi:hypothetical protein
MSTEGGGGFTLLLLRLFKLSGLCLGSGGCSGAKLLLLPEAIGMVEPPLPVQATDDQFCQLCTSDAPKGFTQVDLQGEQVRSAHSRETLWVEAIGDGDLDAQKTKAVSSFVHGVSTDVWDDAAETMFEAGFAQHQGLLLDQDRFGGRPGASGSCNLLDSQRGDSQASCGREDLLHSEVEKRFPAQFRGDRSQVFFSDAIWPVEHLLRPQHGGNCCLLLQRGV